MSGTTIEQILEQAVRFEEQAYEFYINALNTVKRPHIQDTLGDLATEEVKHKERLQALLAGDPEALVVELKRGKIEDLKLAEYLVAPTLGQDATFQDVLVVAMHREKSSHEFYSTMVTITVDKAAKDLFGFLAQEELLHKNKVESLYDEFVYQEN